MLNHEPSFTHKPRLGYILVGNKPDSEMYINMKSKACKKLGIDTVGKIFDENVEEQEVVDYVSKLNEDKTIDGILVQLPLPEHLDANVI